MQKLKKATEKQKIKETKLRKKNLSFKLKNLLHEIKNGKTKLIGEI